VRRTAQSCYVEWSGRDSNSRSLGCKSDDLTITSPRHTVHNEINKIFETEEVNCLLALLTTFKFPKYCPYQTSAMFQGLQNSGNSVLALDLEGVQDVKLHHPSSSVATSNQ